MYGYDDGASTSSRQWESKLAMLKVKITIRILFLLSWKR